MTPDTFCCTHKSASCSANHSMTPPAADGNKYTDPSQTFMKRVRDFRTLSPMWDVSIKSFLQDSWNPTEEEAETV